MEASTPSKMGQASPVNIRGVWVESRYNLQHEIDLMSGVIETLTAQERKNIESIFCDSKATNCYTVRMTDVSYTDLPNIKLLAMSIGTMIGPRFTIRKNGHNGIYVVSHAGALLYEEPPEWYDGAWDRPIKSPVKPPSGGAQWKDKRVDLPRVFALKELLRRKRDPYGLLFLPAPTFIMPTLIADEVPAFIWEARLPFPRVIVEIHQPHQIEEELPGLDERAATVWFFFGERPKMIEVSVVCESGHGKFHPGGRHYFYTKADRAWRRMRHTIGNFPSDAIVDSQNLQEFMEFTSDNASNQMNMALYKLSNMRNIDLTSLPASRRNAMAARAIPHSGWQYQVVTIEQILSRPTSHEPAGGTHASPRWHERRGHWRKLRSGKQVWVRHCEVGDKERGGVVHDYRVEAGQTNEVGEG